LADAGSGSTRPVDKRGVFAAISVSHGVGGMFAASGAIIFSNEPP